jgi:hypothetical protein
MTDAHLAVLIVGWFIAWGGVAFGLTLLVRLLAGLSR